MSAIVNELPMENTEYLIRLSRKAKHALHNQQIYWSAMAVQGYCVYYLDYDALAITPELQPHVELLKQWEANPASFPTGPVEKEHAERVR